MPVALGFGISTGAQAAAAADAGADGVIVGSRLVRAVAEAATRAGSRRGGGVRRGGAGRRPRPLAFGRAWACYLTLIAGLVVWIVLLGASAIKSFDAFLITIAARPAGRDGAHRARRSCPAAAAEPDAEPPYRRVRAQPVLPL